MSREDFHRRIVVESNIRGRDLGGFVADAQNQIRETVSLPQGYFLRWGGQYEHLQDATRRLAVVIPHNTRNDPRDAHPYFWNYLRPALLIFLNVPLALSGGLLALWVRGLPLSISAVIGCVALFGIAVLNGVVLVSRIRSLEARMIFR